ncbi:nitrophenyl compound nitroreductase subunit ArsF family protein [uncultured Acetobacteroides sp.]|uniref:nitrophenyl compound nitroreductase subunit ArsF family protein n=1 Tax=uncultured Acetobacteroides sp. TaxID=1760811 RepID=UPI0029F4E7E5|nr:nitrophenyl compound nitroreductase subunit ArsF family protein [uncultured Acetobacteroides sp.]
MKHLFLLSLALMLAVAGFSADAKSAKKEAKATVNPKVEVYYFHFTRRCPTCLAVESESKKAVEALYPAQVKSGQVTFTSINLDDASSKAAASKCKAEGQSLLVVSGSKRADLTSKGFMYAKSNPEKLKVALGKAIEEVLKK